MGIGRWACLCFCPFANLGREGPCGAHQDHRGRSHSPCEAVARGARQDGPCIARLCWQPRCPQAVPGRKPEARKMQRHCLWSLWGSALGSPLDLATQMPMSIQPLVMPYRTWPSPWEAQMRLPGEPCFQAKHDPRSSAPIPTGSSCPPCQPVAFTGGHPCMGLGTRASGLPGCGHFRPHPLP